MKVGQSSLQALSSFKWSYPITENLEVYAFEVLVIEGEAAGFIEDQISQELILPISKWFLT
jgi:hypothetical protein